MSVMVRTAETGARSRWRAPRGLMVIASRDVRRRYRFIVEPLRTSGIEPEIVEDRGGLLSLFSFARRTLRQRQDAALVLLCGADVRSFIWTLAIRRYSSARVVIRFGGHPIDVRSDQVDAMRRQGRYLAAARAALQRWASRRLLPRLDGVIAVSRRLRDDLVQLAPGARCAHIPQFVDARRFGACRYENGDTLRVLTAANLAYRAKYECVWQLIEWLNELAGSMERPVRYEIIGGGGGEKILRDRLAGLTLADGLHVEVAGYVDEPEAHYEKADIFAYFSALEGLPNVILEAQACGLPILINRDPMFADLLAADDNALFFDPADADEFSSQFYRLASDVALRERLGRANREAVLVGYSRQGLAPQIEEYFDEVERSNA